MKVFVQHLRCWSTILACINCRQMSLQQHTRSITRTLWTFLIRASSVLSLKCKQNTAWPYHSSKSTEIQVTIRSGKACGTVIGESHLQDCQYTLVMKSSQHLEHQSTILVSTSGRWRHLQLLQATLSVN